MVEQGESLPPRHDLDAVAGRHQILCLGVELDKNAGMFANDHAAGALGHAGGHDRVVADAVEVMQRMVAPGIGVVIDTDTRLYMVAGPSEGPVAAANIVSDSEHAGQHGGRPVGVRDVLSRAHRGCRNHT